MQHDQEKLTGPAVRQLFDWGSIKMVARFVSLAAPIRLPLHSVFSKIVPTTNRQKNSC